MPSILIIVFTLQLFIYLVNSIGAKQINDLLWHLSSFLPASLFPGSKQATEQIRLRREVVRLKREMGAVSAQDDFARWAKIRREHDKVLAEHDKVASQVTASRSSFDTKASALRWVSTTGLRFGLQFWHGKQPMFEVPRGWFPWYVEWVLGFPRCPYGGVSINIWGMVCANVIAIVGDVVMTAIGTGQEKQVQKQKVPVGVQAEKQKS